MSDEDKNYVEGVIITIDGVDYDDVVNSTSEEAATPTKKSNTMNKRRRARGFKQGNDDFKFSMNCERLEAITGGALSWEQMRDQRKRFNAHFKPSVGKSYTYGPCVVESVSDKTSAGDSSQDVSVQALDKKYNPI
jgi:hypothetical protein